MKSQDVASHDPQEDMKSQDVATHDPQGDMKSQDAASHDSQGDLKSEDVATHDPQADMKSQDLASHDSQDMKSQDVATHDPQADMKSQDVASYDPQADMKSQDVASHDSQDMKSQDVASHDPIDDVKSEDFYVHLNTSELTNCFRREGQYRSYFETDAHQGNFSTEVLDSYFQTTTAFKPYSDATCSLQIRVPSGRRMFLEVTNASQKHSVFVADFERHTGKFNDIVAEHFLQDTFYQTTANGAVIILKVVDYIYRRDYYVNFRFVTVSASDPDMETMPLYSSHTRVKHGNKFEFEFEFFV
jgi:hypothetical protein